MQLANQRLLSGMIPVEANLYRNLKVCVLRVYCICALHVPAARLCSCSLGGSLPGWLGGHTPAEGLWRLLLTTAQRPPQTPQQVAASKAATGAPANGANGAPPPAAAPPPRYKPSTLLLHPPQSSVTDPYGASGPPLYQTATFAQPGATEFGPYDYTRSGNPTRTLLEEQWAALEGADRSFAFTSGMAALAVVTRLVGVGEHVVAGDDIYGGTSRLLANVSFGRGCSFEGTV